MVGGHSLTGGTQTSATIDSQKSLMTLWFPLQAKVRHGPWRTPGFDVPRSGCPFLSHLHLDDHPRDAQQHSDQDQPVSRHFAHRPIQLLLPIKEELSFEESLRRFKSKCISILLPLRSHIMSPTPPLVDEIGSLDNKVQILIDKKHEFQLDFF